ncbi:MAG: restriction endonuclease subunit S [Clostridia bacterium]|nr:restriction endonuclease subunit S [Clostridia bacterium]
MKDSGLKWIGVIPDNWTLAKYKHFTQNRMGETILATDTVDDGIPIYSATQGNSIFGYVKSARVILHKNDFVIPARGNSIGCVTIVNYEIATCTQTTICSTDIHDINIWYLYYCCVGLKFKWFDYDGSAIPQITIDQIENNVLPYPPINEQSLIVDVLNRIVFHIDNIIEKTKESIEEYKKLKQAIITQAVTKGVRGDRTMKDSGEKWIGEIPNEWSTYRICSLYEERHEAGNDSLPILTVSINTGVSDKELSDEENDRIFVRSEDKTKYARVYPGDLTYNMMRAWQGAFGAVRVDGMVSPAYVIAKPKTEVDSRYMEALLRTPSAMQEMKRFSYGIADFRMRLYWRYFKNIKVCLPSLSEQKEIADYIDIKAKEIDELISKKEKLLEELDDYKKSMIYEYVTGKKEVK